MAIDRNKIKQNVDKFVRARKFPEAIRELLKLVEDNPKDINSLQQLGNLYLLANEKEQAVPVFIKIAELYQKSGFVPKAVASIKIALRESPENLQAQELYASLSEQTGLQREAIDAYERLTSTYIKNGQLDKAEKSLERLLELNPDSAKFLLQHGDILVRLNKKEEAIPSYLKAANSLVSTQKIKEAAKIFERILQIDSKQISLLEKIVSELISRKEADKALELINSLFVGREAPPIIDEIKIDILISLQEFDKAEATLLKIAKEKPIKGSLLAKFLKLYVNQKKFEPLLKLLASQIPKADIPHLKELEIAFEELIAQSPSLIEAIEGLIVVERKLDNKSKLLSQLNKYSDLLIERKDFKKAESVVKEMLEIAPNEMQLVSKLDDIREKLGIVPPPLPKTEIKEPEISIIDREEEFKGKEEVVQVDVGEIPEVEIEVELEDISNELPVVKEVEKPEEVKVEQIPVEEVEVTSSFSTIPEIGKIKEEEEIIVEVEEEKVEEEKDEEKEEIKEVEQDTEVKVVKEIVEEESEVEEEKRGGAQLDERTAASVREKLSEIQIYLKYGLVEKAITELQAILKMVPDHIQAHQKLIAIYRQLDNKDKLVRQIIKLAKVYKEQGDDETVANLVEEAMQIDPNHKSIIQFQQKEPLQPAKKEKDKIDILDSLLKGEKAEVKGKLSEAQAEEKKVEDEEKEEIEVEIEEKREEREESVDVEIEIDEKSISKGEDILEEVSKEEEKFEKVEEVIEKASPKEELTEEETFKVSISEEEIEASNEMYEKLEEAEFYLAQELYEEAKNIVEELLSKFPNDSKVIELSQRVNETILQYNLKKQKEQEEIISEDKEELEELTLLDKDLVEGLGGVIPVKRKPKVKVTLRDIVPQEERVKEEEIKPITSGEVEEYYDLAKELGAVLDGLEESASGLFEDDEGVTKSQEEVSFEEVFQEFKKGVEKKVPEEDYDTHYNLGIAYKEMELIDEAIAEFQISAKSPIYFADSCAMLGKCFQAKGLNDLAEKWYKKGLDSKGFSEEVYNGLKYDLAELLESLGRSEEALQLYKDVYASNANYREVREKIASLS